MEKSRAIQDFPSTVDLQARTLLILNVTPDLSFDRSTDFFEDLKTLIGYRKQWTISKIDYVQSDLCEFKTYRNYMPYIDCISQWNTVVVNWVPACHMPFRITTQLLYQ